MWSRCGDVELTSGGNLGVPSFKRIRVDEPPEEGTIDSMIPYA